MTATAPTGFQTPSFLQGGSWNGLNKLQGQIPGLFDTSALQTSYQNQAGSNMDQGRALAAAAGAAYQNRAQQSGASQQGSGFAMGQAMLPIYAQNNSLMSDLATKQLQARTAQAGVQSDIAGRIGQLQSARQGQLSDLYGNWQRLQQNKSQFNQDLGFRNKEMAQNQMQFGASQREKSREFDVQAGQQSQMNRLQALGLAMKLPRQSYSYHTNLFGNPINGADASAMQGSARQNDFYSGLQNQLQSFF